MTFLRRIRALTSDLPQTAIAQASGLAQSTVSRLLAGDRPVDTDHLRALLRTIPNEDDRLDLVADWLRDCCPEEFRDRLRITVGGVSEARPIRDALTRDLAALERRAADDAALRRVLAYLATDPPDSQSNQVGGRPTATLPRSA